MSHPPLYVETSALLNALLEGNAALRRTLVESPVLVTSRLTLTEARRALRRAQHTRRITAAQRTLLLNALAEFEARCRVLALDEAVCARAEETFPVEHVATLDALHLASAVLYQQEVEQVAVASCDARVRENAVALGFALVPG